MAAALMHNGLKRTFAQMHHDGYANIASSSRSTSRPPSPSPIPGLENTNRFVVKAENGLGLEAPCPTTFHPEASILLIGIRGVGKSTLAILAATAYERKVVDFERVFCEATGLTAIAFRKQYGSTTFQQRHSELLRSTLDEHSWNCIIVCSFADIEGLGAGIIRDFAQYHPVVHVTRDATGIQGHLKTWPKDRISHLLHASEPLLERCSNFDFFNLTEQTQTSTSISHVNDNWSTNSSPVPNAQSFLTLKRVEHDFLKFLRNILGDHSRGPSHHSAYPLSRIPVEDRNYTFSAKIAIQDVLSGTVELDDAQIGADALELVVDDSSAGVTSATEDCPVAKAFAILRKATILPIILTVENEECRSDPEAGYQLSKICLRLSPEYVTLSLELSSSQIETLMARKGRTKIIGLKDWRTRPERGWLDEQCMLAYSRTEQLGCDLAKLVMPAKSPDDCFAVLTFRQQVEAYHRSPKLVAYCTGPLGRTSWCFNKILTSVQLAGPSESLARLLMQHSMATSQALTKSLYATFQQDAMRFLIYGANTSYSLSPAMHNAAYKACGMPHIYETSSSNSLDRLKRIAQDPTFGGSAITQPFKTNVISMLDGLSAHARAIGAINTIIPIRQLAADGTIPSNLEIMAQRNQRGPVEALYGDNTDWIGIRSCLRRGLSPANTVRPYSTALVCGAGGMARAAVYSMLSLGVKNVFICNRTLANAQELADHYNNLLAQRATPELDSDGAEVHVIEDFQASWPKGFRHPTMIVVGIPAQPTDNSPPANFTIPEAWLKSPTGGVAVELAYRPLKTPLVEQMQREAHRGWILMDGFDMLPEQGFAQFELFTGRRAPRKIMRDEVVKRYEKEQAGIGDVSEMQQIMLSDRS